ncbi:hypothetical protein LL033_14665 [Clostridium estertheticum]|uniref:hypothetical protein n=1 Tax=Clostridium estertheticum TaxID=238834 RepID=UPI001C0D2FC3|nr:hypothetical protein [Clostridium estertheticum]MBU3218203.1 hypothetical protein [Clostridium estertheticum]WAG53889.1 hypothetical protein LL033_14665 [Clostridium estertheticum]
MYKYRIIVSIAKMIFRWPSNTEEKYSMLKKFAKKISMVLLSSSLLICTSMPAFASTQVRDSKAAVSGTVLTDGVSLTQNITAGTSKTFTLTVNDYELRNIVVNGVSQATGAVPVKTSIEPVTTLKGYIAYDSGDFRAINQIGWHFIPGSTYNVTVTAQSTADVTVSMHKSSGSFNSVYDNSNTISEKNMLLGGQIEQYGFAFKQAGRYLITLSTGGKLNATYVNNITPSESSSNINLANTEWSKYVTVTTADMAQNTCALVLQGTDPVGNGSTYNVTVTKVN